MSCKLILNTVSITVVPAVEVVIQVPTGDLSKLCSVRFGLNIVQPVPALPLPVVITDTITTLPLTSRTGNTVNADQLFLTINDRSVEQRTLRRLGLPRRRWRLGFFSNITSSKFFSLINDHNPDRIRCTDRLGLNIDGNDIEIPIIDE